MNPIDNRSLPVPIEDIEANLSEQLFYQVAKTIPRYQEQIFKEEEAND